MPIKKYKPTTPGRRGMSTLTFEEITKTTPEKSLLAPLKSKGGRNNLGRITTRHQGGGHKRAYRIIDFKRNKDGIRLRSLRSSTIQTVRRISRCFTMLMVKSVILSRQKA